MIFGAYGLSADLSFGPAAALLFAGYVEIADPCGACGVEILAGYDFEGALFLQVAGYAIAGYGIHFEEALALKKREALGDGLAKVMKALSQQSEGFAVTLEIRVEVTGQLECEESVRFQNPGEFLEIVEGIARSDVLEDDRRVGEVDRFACEIGKAGIGIDDESAIGTSGKAFFRVG